MIIVLLLIAYFGSALVFRSYGDDSQHQNESVRIASSEEEAIDFLLSPFNQPEPTLLERFYAPAESVFRVFGI